MPIRLNQTTKQLCVSTILLTLSACSVAPHLPQFATFSGATAISFSPTIIEGDRLWVSGVVGVPQANEQDVEAAFVSAFNEVESILHRSGADWHDVMDVVTYHTDLGQQTAVLESVTQRYLQNSGTAWQAQRRDRLALDGAVVEIKIIATLPQDRAH